MSELASTAKTTQAPAPKWSVPSGGLAVRRKCACGGQTSLTGECSACRAKRLGGGKASGGRLPLSRPGDALEREADRVAERVLAGSEVGVALGGGGLEVRRACASCDAEEENAVLREAGAGAVQGGVPAPTASRILGARGGGRALPSSERSFFEPRLRASLARVRVHDDAGAARSASELGAKAFAYGSDVFFARGRYQPGTPDGRRLLAHELAHVLQASPVVAREPEGEDCPKGEQEATLIELEEPIEAGGQKVAHYYVYTYGGEGEAEFGEKALEALLTNEFSPAVARSPRITRGFSWIGEAPAKGCQVQVYMSEQRWQEILDVAEEIRRAQPPTPASEKREDPPPVAGDDPKSKGEKGKRKKGKKDGSRDGGAGGTLAGKVEDAAKETERKELIPASPLRPNAQYFQDPELAQQFLLILEHFARRPITAQDRKAAADGFDAEELEAILGDDALAAYLAQLYTQGFREFVAADGESRELFFRLEETIIEQYVRGNPTAVRNDLKIGKAMPFGSRQVVLGIVDRRRGWLLYNQDGFPMPGITGLGQLDKGYIGAEQFGVVNIAEIEDPALQGLLNLMRQELGDPLVMTGEAASKLMDHIELVKAKVWDGLPREVAQQFADSLPFFIGFLIGHGVSALLMRATHPALVAVGLALKGLLKAAEYVMTIQASASAMERLLQAAHHVSRIEVDDDGKLTGLSRDHIDKAAEPIRKMVAEIAMTVGTIAAGRSVGALISRIRGGKATGRINCTECQLGEDGKPLLKGEERAQPKEAAKKKGDGDDGPARLEEGPTPREAAKAELQRLEAEFAKEKADLAALKKERLAWEKQAAEANLRRLELLERMRTAKGKEKARLREEAKKAVEKRNEAREELDAFPDDGFREADARVRRTGEKVERARSIADPDTHRASLPCFDGSTQVLLADGRAAAIESLTAGDMVLGYKLAEGRAEPVRVAEVFRNRTEHFYRLEIDDDTVRATGRHPFWVGGEENRWMQARDLLPGMTLQSPEGVKRLDAVEREDVAEQTSWNLAIDGPPHYFVGSGTLVHNQDADGVDVKLGGQYFIYRGTNPNFPGQVYIGQTGSVEDGGKARTVAGRQSEHRAKAVAELKRPDLSAADRKFWTFMKDVELKTVVRGLKNADQASYIEQRNMDFERDIHGKDSLMNRREQLTSTRKAVSERIKADPAVQKAGYCLS